MSSLGGLTKRLAEMTRGNGRKVRPKPQRFGADGLTDKDGRSPAPRDYHDRRPLRFWQPFNDWWRSELERNGRRPSAQEIMAWYETNAVTVWKDEAPTLQETRVHAKCLRSLPLVRDYFRNYRAKKRSMGERSGSPLSPGSGDDGDLRDDEDYPEGADGDPDGGHLATGDDADMDGTDGGGDPYPDVGRGFLGSPATAGLNQLAALRALGSPAGSTPLELMQGGLPNLLNPPASALWPSAAAAALAAGAAGSAGVLGLGSLPAGLAAALAPGLGVLAGSGGGLDAAVGNDTLLRSLTLQQLQQAQQAAALQQQLALATIAQNLALGRAAGIGTQAILQAAAAPPQATSTLVGMLEAGPGGKGEEERPDEEDAAGGSRNRGSARRRGEGRQFRQSAGRGRGGGPGGSRRQHFTGTDGDVDDMEDDMQGFNNLALLAAAGGALGMGKPRGFAVGPPTKRSRLGAGPSQPAWGGRPPMHEDAEEEQYGAGFPGEPRSEGQDADDFTDQEADVAAAGNDVNAGALPGPTGRRTASAAAAGAGPLARRSGAGQPQLPLPPSLQQTWSQGQLGGAKPHAAPLPAARGTPLAAARPFSKRRLPGGASPVVGQDGADGLEDGQQPLALPSALPLPEVPAGLTPEPLPRHVLLTLSRDELVDRVLVLQAHMQLLQQQQHLRQLQLDRKPQGQRLVGTPTVTTEDAQEHEVQGACTTPPPPMDEAARSPAVQALVRQRPGQYLQAGQRSPGEPMQGAGQDLPSSVRCLEEWQAKEEPAATAGGNGFQQPQHRHQQQQEEQQKLQMRHRLDAVAAAAAAAAAGVDDRSGSAGEQAPSDGDSGLPEIMVLPEMTGA